jgi:hypothetical protein
MSRQSCQKARPSVASRTGMAAMASALTTSETTDTRRAPSRSTNGPPSPAARASGMVSLAAAMPVFDALPVDDRTYQGMASSVIVVPTVEIVLAVSSDRSGRRLTACAVGTPGTGR